MKRTLFFGISLIIIDQLLRLYFQTHYVGKKLLLLDHWGFTYTVNYGLWINPNMSDKIIAMLFAIVVSVWVLAYYLVKFYHKHYGKSLLIDLSFGFFTAGALGNVIDKLFLGYIRDYFINPIATSNLADISIYIALIFYFLEISIYPKSRQLLRFNFSLSPWYSNLKTFISFIRGKYNT